MFIFTNPPEIFVAILGGGIINETKLDTMEVIEDTGEQCHNHGLPNFPEEGRTNAQMHYANGKLYLIGGEGKLKNSKEGTQVNEITTLVSKYKLCLRYYIGSSHFIDALILASCGITYPRISLNILNPFLANVMKLNLDASKEDRTWTDVAPMPRGRTLHFGIEYFNGKLLVFGGAGVVETTRLDAIDEYDILADQWSTIPETLELETETITVKVNYQTIWVFLWKSKELRIFDLITRTFQMRNIPAWPNGKQFKGSNR